MIITPVIAMLTLGAAQADMSPLTCSVMGRPATIGGPSMDYKGVRYVFCCSMCPADFQKDPEAIIHGDKAKGKTIGIALFDPISDARINTDQAKASSDYNGVRYLFTTADEKKSFDATPEKFTAIPDKEALYCPVEKQAISSYAAAGSYRDYKGVRYYFCCNSCPSEFDKSPDKYAPNAASYVATPKALAVSDAKAPKADAGAFTPLNFNCKHCGNPMSINSPDDAKSICSVCGCNKKMADCNPGN